MITGWQLLTARAGRDLADGIEEACVRFGNDAKQVTGDELEAALSRMRFYEVDDMDWWGKPTPPGEEASFQVWSTKRIYWPDVNEGFARIYSIPRYPEEWLETERVEMISNGDRE